MKGDPNELRYELADLVYHMWVLLQQQGVTPEMVWAELQGRFYPQMGTDGHR